MVVYFVLFFFVGVNGLKVWIPNTDADNKLNWDKQDTPKNCDNIHFPGESDVATYWNVKDLVLCGLSLSRTGDVIFPHNMKIQFRDKEKCPSIRDLNYIRNDIKGWLDPYNWDSSSSSQWLPHSERVPCAGEDILFSFSKTFAIQLPNVLVPMGEITFDTEVYQADTWSSFLKTDVGSQIFKGPDDLRNFQWRNDAGCSDKKKCICSRSSYTIRNGLYEEVDSREFEEAVCLYARKKCENVKCYSPVKPDGHCCGICGAVIKLEDKTEDGLDIADLKKKVREELVAQKFENELKTYVGRTKDGNIQIVIVAEKSDSTMNSHALSELIKRKLMGQKLQVSSRLSGLTFGNYVFNNISGVIFGTLFGVLSLFVSVFYIFTILPKKKLDGAKPFLFARFDNTLHEAGSEENLEIGVEPEVLQELPQAFDNPMYSEIPGSSASSSKAKDSLDTTSLEDKKSPETCTTKEYNNPIYSEIEKAENLDIFQKKEEEREEEFSDVKL